MPPTHTFLIPMVFFTGLLVGAAVVRARLGVAGSRHSRVRERSILVVTFRVFLAVFATTHALEFPGGAASLEAARQGQPLLDKLPSFTAQEVHARLDGFGAEGRKAYQRFTFTSDVAFPLSLLLLLLSTAASAFVSSGAPARVRKILLVGPLLWFLCDMIENGIVYQLLTQFPRLDPRLAGVVGLVTLAKFGLLASSIALQAVVAATHIGTPRSRSFARVPYGGQNQDCEGSQG